jgi:phosphoserine phosphatase
VINAIICDWNGTLIEDLYEEEFFNGLAKRIIMNFPNCINVCKICRFLLVKRQIKSLIKYCKNSKDKAIVEKNIKEIIDLMNEDILRDEPAELLSKYTVEYATDACSRLDGSLIENLISFIKGKNVLLGVISSGYVEGIERILAHRGYKFDVVIANNFIINECKIKKYSLDIFNNKSKILKKLLEDKGILPERTVYIGDDWQDEECFREVRYPIFSFFADEEYKKSLSRKLDVFIPKNENALKNYLSYADGL